MSSKSCGICKMCIPGICKMCIPVGKSHVIPVGKNYFVCTVTDNPKVVLDGIEPTKDYFWCDGEEFKPYE